MTKNDCSSCSRTLSYTEPDLGNFKKKSGLHPLTHILRHCRVSLRVCESASQRMLLSPLFGDGCPECLANNLTSIRQWQASHPQLRSCSVDVKRCSFCTVLVQTILRWNLPAQLELIGVLSRTLSHSARYMTFDNDFAAGIECSLA